MYKAFKISISWQASPVSHVKHSSSSRDVVSQGKNGFYISNRWAFHDWVKQIRLGDIILSTCQDEMSILIWCSLNLVSIRYWFPIYSNSSQVRRSGHNKWQCYHSSRSVIKPIWAKSSKPGLSIPLLESTFYKDRNMLLSVFTEPTCKLKYDTMALFHKASVRNHESCVLQSEIIYILYLIS